MSQRSHVEIFKMKQNVVEDAIKNYPERVKYTVEEVCAVNRHARRKPLPEIGSVWNHLTVKGYILTEFGGVLGTIVECDCGSGRFMVDVYSLRLGRSQSCNVCARKTAANTRKRYNGYADILPDNDHRERLLNRIASCIQRCHNPNDAGYPNYGGRGIGVHEPWRTDRRQFLAYLITLKDWDIPEYEMDRIDCDKGYEPGNLRFITRKANMMNKRSVQELQSRVNEQADYISDLEAKIYDLENMLHDRFEDN